jgi:hypothetical protein
MSLPALPKLSVMTKMFTSPEEMFEKTVKDALKVELPPGPMSVLFKIQESIEAGKPPAFETLLPKLPTGGGGSSSSSSSSHSSSSSSSTQSIPITVRVSSY